MICWLILHRLQNQFLQHLLFLQVIQALLYLYISDAINFVVSCPIWCSLFSHTNKLLFFMCFKALHVDEEHPTFKTSYTSVFRECKGQGFETSGT